MQEVTRHRGRLWLILIPWVSILVFFAFAGLAAQQVGHWPLYSRPDPKQVEILSFRVGLIGEPVVFFFLLVLISAVAGLRLLWDALMEVVDSRSVVSPAASRALTKLSACLAGCMALYLALEANATWLVD